MGEGTTHDHDGAAAVAEALARSHLARIPEPTLAGLLDHGRLRDVGGGIDLHREGDDLRHLELVVHGLVRVFVAAPDGRTLTVRYCRPGSLLGAISMFASGFSMPASVRSVTPTRILAMPVGEIAAAVDRDPVVARALLDELSERAMAFLREIPGSAFATVRQKVCRHLLDLASAAPATEGLVVRVSQQQLAEAVGSVREVVVRVLRDLREEGLVTTGHDGIEIDDPERLAAEAYPVPVGPSPEDWNPGS
jgi:CRP-like cAMP-binding protein